MDALLLLARLALAAVFLVAGAAKLVDLPGSIAAMRGFGIPERLTRPMGLLLPVAELLIAVLLLPNPTALAAAALGAILLGAFVAGMLLVLRRGEAPDCHCFGQLHSEPVSMRSVARNLALLALALFTLTAGGGDPGTSPFAPFDDLSGTEAVLLVGLLLALGGIAVEGWLITHLLGQNGRLLLRMDALENAPGSEAQAPDMADGLNIGTPLPTVSLTSLDGQPTQLTSLIQRSRPTLVVVSDPNCGPCKTLRPEIAAWQRDHGQRLNVVLISRGDSAINRNHAEEHGISSVYLEADRAASKALDVTGTPSAVLISREGTIASEVAAGAVAIRALVARSTEKPTIPLNGTRRAPSPLIGTPAPSISLPDLDDQQRSLDEWAGKKRVLLFWNPGCGFCRRLAPEVQAWSQSRTPGDPELILVSTGTADDNHSLGIDAPTLLENGFGAGRSFGASGTPSAIAIDEEGRIASALAVGGPDVMRLLGADRPSSGLPAASSNGTASAPQPAPTPL